MTVIEMEPQRLAAQHWSEGDKANPFKEGTDAWREYEDKWLILQWREEESI